MIHTKKCPICRARVEVKDKKYLTHPSMMNAKVTCTASQQPVKR